MGGMEFRLLGPLVALDASGGQIKFASQTQRRLVCLLAQRANTMVPSTVIEEHLRLSPGALRTSISRLRRIVGFDTLVSAPPGYELRTDCVDVQQFEGLLERARSSDDAAAQIALTEAVGLWRGDAYEEFAHEEWAAADSNRLAELLASATEELAELLLDGGEGAAAIAMLESVIALHPYRDRPRALVMRALARTGRRTDALREFQAYRARLIDEVGVEPSSFLVILDRAIAANREDDVRSLPTLPENRSWRRERRAATLAHAAPVNNLPAPTSSFVGREREITTVTHLVNEQRIVTLTGAGGCGKTRLALRVAGNLLAAHRGGTWWVDLAPVTSADHVDESLAAATGHVVVGTGAAGQVARQLRNAGPVLIVLDNAEHVVDGVARLVDVLLSECSNVRVLITSREPLGLPGELVWHVPSLSSPDPNEPMRPDELEDFDAARLFLERAKSARPDLVVDDAVAAHVVSICASLDGLPLALELAAAHVRSIPLDLVVAGLDDALRLLSMGSRHSLGRHQTLHASIAWSVDLLDEAERAVLTRLAVFRSSFPFDAAAAVAADDGVDATAAIGAVGRLVDKSLLELDSMTSRYRMLETIRQFCLQRARGDRDLEEARARHARYIASWCMAVGDARHGVERTPFVREMPDVVAALDWAMGHAPVEAFRICIGLASVRTVLGHNAHLAQTWSWLMAFDHEGDLAAEWAASVAGMMSAATGLGLDVSNVAADVSLRLSEQDDRASRWLARGRAMVPAYSGNVEPMLEYVEAIVANRDDMEISVYAGFAAYMLALGGRLDDAARWIDEQQRMIRRQDAVFSVDTVGNGYAAAILVDATRGELAAAAARASAKRPADPVFSMTSAEALAYVALMSDDAATLRRAIDWSTRETIPMCRALVHWIDCARAMFDGDTDAASNAAERYWDETAVICNKVHLRAHLNVPLLQTGRVAAVEAGIEETVLLVTAMVDMPLCEAIVHQSRAQLALYKGDIDRVHGHAHAMVDIAHRRSFVPMLIDGLELLAVTGSHTGSTDVASILDATRAGRERTGYRFVMIAPRHEYDQLVLAMPPRSGATPSLDDAVEIARRRR